MLVDAAQILRDCHKVRRRQIYGHLDALVRPTLTLNAKRKLFSHHKLHIFDKLYIVYTIFKHHD